MTQPQLAQLARSNKQTVARLEIGPPKGMKLTRQWAEKFAPHLGYSAEQILFWDEHFGPDAHKHLESEHVLAPAPAAPDRDSSSRVVELDLRAGMGGGGVPATEVRRDGRYADPVKAEGWSFPASFLRDTVRTAPGDLFVLETGGDSMLPTIASGERVVVNARHRMPTPDGIYALRDTFGAVIVKRLQITRAPGKPRVRIISDNPNHGTEEVGLDEIEIVGKVEFCLKRI